MLYVACRTLHPVLYMLGTPHIVQSLVPTMQHATRNVRHAKSNTQRRACNVHRARAIVYCVSSVVFCAGMLDAEVVLRAVCRAACDPLQLPFCISAMPFCISAMLLLVPVACCMLHLFRCICSASCAASAARFIARMESVCLHRAALRCTRVQGDQGSVLFMSNGDAMFESMAISITSAKEVTELTRKVALCVMLARSLGSRRCLTGSEYCTRHPRAYELARQRHGAQDVQSLRHHSPHDALA
jgi:hypothetical protein